MGALVVTDGDMDARASTLSASARPSCSQCNETPATACSLICYYSLCHLILALSSPAAARSQNVHSAQCVAHSDQAHAKARTRDHAHYAGLRPPLGVLAGSWTALLPRLAVPH